MTELAQAPGVGVIRGFGAVRRAGLVEDAANVTQHGIQADEKLIGNLLVRLAGGDEAEHLRLTLAQSVRECRTPRCSGRFRGRVPKRYGFFESRRHAHGLKLGDGETKLRLSLRSLLRKVAEE